jgi:primosomal protein N' (replication factor Y)
MPDFRASERTFQLIVQVAGRAGRAEKPGRVIIQTIRPDNFCIQTAAELNYDAFAAREMALRKPLRYPPFGRLLKITVSAKKEAAAFEKARAIQVALARAISSIAPLQRRPPASVLGPAPAPLARIKGEYRYQVLLKADTSKLITDIVGKVREEMKSVGRTHVSLDRDPYSML